MLRAPIPGNAALSRHAYVKPDKRLIVEIMTTGVRTIRGTSLVRIYVGARVLQPQSYIVNEGS